MNRNSTFYANIAILSVTVLIMIFTFLPLYSFSVSADNGFANAGYSISFRFYSTDETIYGSLADASVKETRQISLNEAFDRYSGIIAPRSAQDIAGLMDGLNFIYGAMLAISLVCVILRGLCYISEISDKLIFNPYILLAHGIMLLIPPVVCDSFLSAPRELAESVDMFGMSLNVSVMPSVFAVACFVLALAASVIHIVLTFKNNKVSS